MTREPQPETHASRRRVLAGLGLAGIAGAVTACGAGASSSATAAAPPPDSAGGTPPAAAGGAVLGRASEIPVGGGTVFAAAKVVVTQPVAGNYRAFSAICTHMQCTVDRVAAGTIDCPCHGSEFSISDGHVVAGPAPGPLPRKSIDIRSGAIVLA